MWCRVPKASCSKDCFYSDSMHPWSLNDNSRIYGERLREKRRMKVTGSWVKILWNSRMSMSNDTVALDRVYDSIRWCHFLTQSAEDQEGDQFVYNSSCLAWDCRRWRNPTRRMAVSNKYTELCRDFPAPLAGDAQTMTQSIVVQGEPWVRLGSYSTS